MMERRLVTSGRILGSQKGRLTMAFALLGVVFPSAPLQASNTTVSVPGYWKPGREVDNVFAFGYLNSVNSPGGVGGYGDAEVWITEFVQNGSNTKDVKWATLQGDKISEITFTFTASDAYVGAVGLVFQTA